MIIDCFTFNKEFDLLEGRLEYLWNTVDYFVIVEADITFSGIPRQFSLVQQLPRYRKYLNKILYFPTTIDTSNLNFNTPVLKFDKNAAAWQVERAQRNHFLTALHLFRDADTVIISDVDEIPSKAGIRVAVDHLTSDTPLIGLKQQMFYYNFNQVQVDPWAGPVIAKRETVVSLTPEGVREQRNKIPVVTNGGWHLSNWMSPEEISEKIKSFSHQEYNTDHFTDVNTITENIKNGGDFLGRDYNKFIAFDSLTLPEDFRSIFLKYAQKSL